MTLPLAGMANGALQYDDTKMGSLTLESMQGMDYAAQNFPGFEKQGTTTIVLSGPDVLGNATRLQVLDMSTSLTKRLAEKDVNVTVVSVYSVIAQYSAGYLLKLRSAYDAVNATITGLGPAEARTTAIGIVAVQANVSGWLVAEISSPAVFDAGQAYLMGSGLVRNSSALSFPVPIPAALLGAMVDAAGTTMLVSLTYPDGDTFTGRNNVGLVRDIVHTAIPDSAGITVYVTGSDAYLADNLAGNEKDMGIIEPLTIILIVVLIGISFRSFVASSMPPMVIGFALFTSIAMLYVMGTFVFSIHYSVLTLMLTSMMGAGCDYCIFILSRYREERRAGKDKNEATCVAIEFAGESILTSGLTVMIGFGVLALANLNMLRSWSVLAIGIGIALMVALTLLPAFIVLLGDRMFWPSKIDRVPRQRKGPGYFTRTARFAIRRAKVILLVTLLVSAPAVYLVITMETSYDMIASMPDNESKHGIVAMTDAFGQGRILPAYVVLRMSEDMETAGVLNQKGMDAIENVSLAIITQGNVNKLTGPTRPDGETAAIDYHNLSAYPADVAAQYLAKIGSMIGTDGRAVMITVIFDAGPYTFRSIDSVKEMRSALAPFANGSVIDSVYVAGSSALVYDIVSTTQADFQLIEVVAIVLIYLVLMVVLGSIINPLRSILTILLSICWTMAAMVVVFQMALGIPILWSIPILLMVVCLGLGMDYDILLTTRIREEASKGCGDHEAIVRSIEQTGGIITVCGVIMASAFATMMLSSNMVLAELGFALGFAILVDATVVRMYLVPAIMSLLGKWNWYAPGGLQRVRKADAASNPMRTSSEDGEEVD